MWQNKVERGRQQVTIWRMRNACWIPSATNTHSEYVILIAFPLQQWLHERASVLRYTYIACLGQLYHKPLRPIARVPKMKYVLKFFHTFYVQSNFRPIILSRDVRRSPRELSVISARYEPKLRRLHKCHLNFPVPNLILK